MPKVSICIPTYNHPELVRRTLDSILIQGFEDYEVIITDDSEGDEVCDLVSGIGDKRVFYYKNTKQLGSPANWNCAIRLAKGEYIKILHHDDWFPNKNCLYQFVRLLEAHPNSVLGFTPAYACRSDGAIAYVHAPSTAQLEELRANPECLVFNNYIGAPSAIIFRNKGHELFDEHLKWLVDIDFYINLLKHSGRSYSYLNEPQICIAIEGEHKVTNECSGKQDIEIFEYIHLLGKIKTMPNKISTVRSLIFLSFLLSRFEVFWTTDFRQITRVQRVSWIHRLALVFGACIRNLRNLKQVIREKWNSLRGEKSRPKVSYSQCGEDIIVDFIFMWLGKDNITYLDVGTNDPVKLNNTYFFYRKKCRGVLIEPDPRLFRKIKRLQTKDTCLNAGVGIGVGRDITFFLMSPDTLSTSSPEKAREYMTLGVKLKNEFKVPMININEVIGKYFNHSAPDYLSIDVEGLDFDIIKSIDLSRYRPIVICAETLTYTNNNTEKKIEEISAYLCSNGYFIYADTYINTIYVNSDVWNKRKVT